LHLLSQRPLLTGSGVTLDSLARQAEKRGWKQAFIVGSPAKDSVAEIAGLDAVEEVRFGQGDLDFPVVGMSDVMPYESKRWSELGTPELERYRDAWQRAIAAAIEKYRPNLIHSNHVWLMSSILKDVTDLPVVTHCHGTGLRQMQLCPHLRENVINGCRRNDRFLALHGQQRRQLAELLNVSPDTVTTVGAGYAENIFFEEPESSRRRNAVVYAGKLSDAKGLGPLLDAIAGLKNVELHVAGAGTGAEAEAIEARMRELGDKVVFHGRLDQWALAKLLRQSAVFVLPSFYEGLPLVVIEALACGSRVVATNLPGIVDEIAPVVGKHLELVDLPPLTGPDRPVPSQVPAFTSRLRYALERAVAAGPIDQVDTTRFSWEGVFGRVEAVWAELLEAG
jgi:glycosyltransferase involved in cell wall biosynthesis